MTDLNLISRIEELRHEIRRHEFLYFVKATPQLSDQKFDQLMNELKKLESEHPDLVTPDSPTQRIGDAITSFNTVKHRVPMMSIENSYSLNDIEEWLKRVEKLAGRDIFPVIAELKIDGVSGSFHYKDGLFSDGATRGNGVEGDVITGNLRTIRSLPLRINTKFDMDIRGEIYTPKSVLLKLNRQRLEEGLEPFKNCRNLTAGTIKSLDPAVVASRDLQVMVYGIAQAKEMGFNSHFAALEHLRNNGFKMNECYRRCNSLQEIEACIKEVEKKRLNYDFDIDGMVLKVDNLQLQEEIGATSKAPRWAIAFKYPQEQAISRIKEVAWQVGRSQLTPVAYLEPVELGGTTVSRASLHNIDQIKEKDIRLGDQVVVEKAGYIIPYIVASICEARTGNETKIRPPQSCPECNGPVYILESSDNSESTIVRCDNPECRGVIARRVLHFITQLEVENFGPQLVDQLLETGNLNQIEDLFNLNYETLVNLDRMGPKSAEKIINNLNQARKANLSRLISALGIENVGSVLGERIADYFNYSLEDFLKADHEVLKKVSGISDKVADSISNYLNSSSGDALLKAVKGWWTGPDNVEKNNLQQKKKLDEKIFVVTGEAELPRKKLEKVIKSFAGQVKSSVSSKTDYLLIGSKEDDSFQSSKKNRAHELKIRIINEFDLFEMVGISIEEVKSNW
jgi:DNA ligase (NAD+)